MATRDWATICKQADQWQRSGGRLSDFARIKGLHRATLYIKMAALKKARQE